MNMKKANDDIQIMIEKNTLQKANMVEDMGWKI